MMARLLVCLLLVCGTSAFPDEAMRYIYDAPESPLDIRYVYQWEILKTALDRTTARYGPYVLEPAPMMTEKRQTFELQNGSGRLTVMYLGTTQELEHTLIPVRIPVDKNLGGYNVLLIRRSDKDRFAHIQTLQDLRAFTIGLGYGWIDVGILQASGFTVVTGTSYDGLFEMLEHGRFDAFLRSAAEVLGELEQRTSQMQDLVIEDSLILYYPLPMYFWFSRNAVGARLAARAQEGLLSMIADGTFDRIFMQYQGEKIRRLHLASRLILRIDNPNLGPETPFGDARLWFRLPQEG